MAGALVAWRKQVFQDNGKMRETTVTPVTVAGAAGQGRLCFLPVF